MGLTKERLRTSAIAPDDSAQISRRTSVTLGIAWAALFPLAMALEPAPASNAPEPWWALVASFVLLGGMIATFVGLRRRRAWGVGASLVASSIFLAGVFACPATGHHAFGLWWIGEFAAAAALVGFSAVAYLRRT